MEKPNKIPLFPHIRFGFLQSFVFFSKKKETFFFNFLEVEESKRGFKFSLKWFSCLSYCSLKKKLRKVSGRKRDKKRRRRIPTQQAEVQKR